MSVLVRRFEDSDAEALSLLYRRSVEGVGPRDYSAEQVAAWAGLAPDAARIRARGGDGRVMLVAVDARDAPVGFIDLEADGHIDMLYCAPEAAGSGVAALLYEQVETIARERRTPRLYSEASEAARRFFLRHGFREIHRRDLVVGGVAIHNFAVEKPLF